MIIDLSKINLGLLLVYCLYDYFGLYFNLVIIFFSHLVISRIVIATPSFCDFIILCSNKSL